MFDLEKSITQWRQQMLNVGNKAVAVDELESHLREEIETLRKREIIDDLVFKSVAEKIGNPNIIKKEFEKARHSNAGHSHSERFFSLLLPALPTIMILLTIYLSSASANAFRAYNLWLFKPAQAVVSPHPGGFSRFADQYAEMPGLAESICLVNVLLFSLILAFAAYLQEPQDLNDIRLPRRAVFYGQCLLGLSALICCFPAPLSGLILAGIICTFFSVILQRPRWLNAVFRSEKQYV